MNDLNVKDALDKPSRLPLSAVTSALVTFVYVSGYLIHSFFIRGKGNLSLSLLNAEYIHAGLVFLGLTSFIIVLPITTCRAVLHGHRPSTAPLATVAATPFVATNYLYLMLFFALFITHSDWVYGVNIYNFNTTLGTVALLYFITVGILLCLIPAIRQFNPHPFGSDTGFFLKSIDRVSYSKPICILVLALQMLEVSVTVFFDIFLWTQLPWFSHFMARLVLLVLALIVVCISAWIIWGWADTYQSKGSQNIFLFVGLPFFVAFYLILISTYTFSVYRNLPVNRGGRYPVTTATLTLKHDYVLPHDLIMKTESEYVVSKPVYVLEDSERLLYIVDYKDHSEWERDAPKVYAIGKDVVLGIEFQSIMDGRPRM